MTETHTLLARNKARLSSGRPASPRFAEPINSKSPVAANWTLFAAAVIHFSTHTRKVKMAALTVSFAGKIGATAPRVANARAAGESPDVPPPPRPSAPFPRSSEILSSSRTAICVLRRPFG